MKILFLCTANSCRSILAEALFNHLAPAGMRAFSAGSEPRGEINPLTLEALARAGIAADGLYSKSSDAHQALNPTSSLPSATRPLAKRARYISGRPPRRTGGLPILPRASVAPRKSKRRSMPRWSGSSYVSPRFSRYRSLNWMPLR